MSLEQSSLGSFDDADDPPAPEDRTPEEQSWTPDGDDDRSNDAGSSCLNCGAHVSRDWRRVMGGNDGLVHACPECASNTDLFDGATVHGLGGGR